MTKILKIRHAWSGKKGRGGAIISLPAEILKEAGVRVGDNLSISVQNGRIVMSKIMEVE